MRRSGAELKLNLKLDLHVHTNKSHDAHTRFEQLAPNIVRTQLDGLAITDHNTLATETSNEPLIIPGVEISTRDGHIIALGASRLVPRGMSADETIQEIRRLGGISIIAHPYDILRSAIRPEILQLKPDAVETLNAASMLHSLTWKRARAYAETHHLPKTAGSDSHIPETIGKAFTIIECEDRTIDSVINAIRQGHTTPVGVPYRFTDRMRKLIR